MRLVAPDWDTARAEAHAAGALLDLEVVGLADGDRRILAEPVVSATALPPFALSAMDGWAVAGVGPWQVVGQVLAGSVREEALADGEAVSIGTGAAVPDRTLGVLRTEHGVVAADSRITGNVKPGQDIRPSGEEALRGEVLITPGTLLGPAHLGLAAAAGADALTVYRQPRARLLVLGDELLDVGPARGGQVRDSLGPQIPQWLKRLGVITDEPVKVEDTLEAHIASLEAAVGVDLVVTTGGTAAGPVDHLHAAIAAVGGDVVVDSVAVRPGHPMLLATLPGNRLLVGLPGNPQSAVIALLTLCAPSVAAMTGRTVELLSDAVLTQDVSAPASETRLLLCTRMGESATPLEHLGSGMLRGLATADGFAVLPPGGLAKGAAARWLSLPS